VTAKAAGTISVIPVKSNRMIEDKKMLESLLRLPAGERLELARILFDSTNGSLQGQSPSENGLLSLAGRYAGGSGSASDHNETQLEDEVDKLSGLSVR
jgi:hypothetical protein